MKKTLREEISDLLKNFQKEFKDVVLEENGTSYEFIEEPGVMALGKFNLKIPMIHSKYLSFLIYLDERISEEERNYSRMLISKSILLRHGATNKIDQARLDELQSHFTDINIDVSQMKNNKGDTEDILKAYDPLLIGTENKINNLKHKKVLIMSMLEQLNSYHWKISNYLQTVKFENGIG